MGSKRSNPDMGIKLVKSSVQTGLRLLSTWWLILDTFLSWQGVLAFSYTVLTSSTLKVNPNICWNSWRCWNTFNSEAKDMSAEKAQVYLRLFHSNLGEETLSKLVKSKQALLQPTSLFSCGSSPPATIFIKAQERSTVACVWQPWIQSQCTKVGSEP